MTALGLLLKAFFWPVWWVLSKSDGVKSTSIFSFKIKSLVFSSSPSMIACSKTIATWILLLSIYYPLQFVNLLVRVNHITFILILSFSSCSCSYSSNLLVIKSIASLNEFNWLLPLIWLSFVFSQIWRSFFISSSNFFMQL